MVQDKESVLHIVMFPWLAFGHMIPNLELAKLIAEKGHRVSFVSTPRNIDRLPKLSPTLINFVKLPLPRVQNLPENAEATTDVPYDAVQYLKKAYDALEQPFTRFLESSKADWLFYDFVPFWAASVASKLGIKTAFYSIFTPPFLGFIGPPSYLTDNNSPRQKPEEYIVVPPWVTFPTTVAFRYYEIMRIVDILSDQNNSGFSDTYRHGAGIQNCDIVVVRGCTEFDAEWFPLLENIYGKPVLPAGQLPSTAPVGSEDNETWRWMKEWLDKQARGSVVYVAFGSEAKPTQDEVAEIALGLEKSELPFCGSWAPQLKILEHVAVGGFLTHSGWTSVVEGIQNEKPLVLLTFLADQGINARVLEEKKMGYSVPRDESDGSFSSDSVAESLKLVVVEEEGKIYRERIKEMKDLFVNEERQNRYIDNLIHNLKTFSKR
ncbi:hypothetical protein ACSQ67_008026 [Phaseolus vulgaris]